MTRSAINHIAYRLARHLQKRGTNPRAFCVNRRLYLDGTLEMAERRSREGKPFLFSTALDRPNFLLLGVPIIGR